MLQSMGSQRVGYDLATELFKILNLITSAKFFLLRKVTYLEVLGFRMWTSLGARWHYFDHQEPEWGEQEMHLQTCL